jgi:hypothetical protein
VKAKLVATTINNLEPESVAYDVRDTDIRGFLLRVLPSGSMSYFYQYRNAKGRQQNYRIGAAKSLKPRQARDVAETLAAKVISGVDIHAEKKAERASGEVEKFQTWSKFLEHQFKPWVLEHRRQGAETIKRLESNFAHLKEKPLTGINNWIIEKWRSDRLKKGVAKATLNRDVGDLKTALTKAAEWGLVDASPIASLKPFKVDESAIVRRTHGFEDYTAIRASRA